MVARGASFRLLLCSSTARGPVAPCLGGLFRRLLAGCSVGCRGSRKWLIRTCRGAGAGRSRGFFDAPQCPPGRRCQVQPRCEFRWFGVCDQPVMASEILRFRQRSASLGLAGGLFAPVVGRGPPCRGGSADGGDVDHVRSSAGSRPGAGGGSARPRRHPGPAVPVQDANLSVGEPGDVADVGQGPGRDHGVPTPAPVRREPRGPDHDVDRHRRWPLHLRLDRHQVGELLSSDPAPGLSGDVTRAHGGENRLCLQRGERPSSPRPRRSLAQSLPVSTIRTRSRASFARGAHRIRVLRLTVGRRTPMSRVADRDDRDRVPSRCARSCGRGHWCRTTPASPAARRGRCTYLHVLSGLSGPLASARSSPSACRDRPDPLGSASHTSASREPAWSTDPTQQPLASIATSMVDTVRIDPDDHSP